jgi:monoamine oxidase
VSNSSARIAIIGGGPGGLMTAYLLQKRCKEPLHISLFEATPRVGGKLTTVAFHCRPDALFEGGAAEFYDYSQQGPDPLKELIAELGLDTVPLSGGSAVVRNCIVTGLSDIRAQFGQETEESLRRFDQRARKAISPAEYYESDWREDNGDPYARKSFAQLLSEIPDSAAARYIQCITHSDLACEPHQTSAAYGLQNYLLDSPEYMRLYAIAGGNEQLTRALAKRLTATILLEQRVHRVVRTPESPGYLIESQGREGMRRDLFDYVVVALPNDCIPSIEWEGPSLRASMESHHQFYDHPAHYLRVTCLFERPFWREYIRGSFFMIDTFGGTCLYDESSRFPADGCGTLGWLIAGEAALRLGNLPDATLVHEVLEALPPALQRGSTRVLESRVHRWANAVNGLPGGFPAREPDSRHQPDPTGSPGLFVVGDYLFDATINGVLDSADTVAEWILSEPES